MWGGSVGICYSYLDSDLAELHWCGEHGGEGSQHLPGVPQGHDQAEETGTGHAGQLQGGLVVRGNHLCHHLHQQVKEGV